MAKDQQLNLGVHLYVERSGDRLDDTAQQQIDESEEHEPTPRRTWFESCERHGRRADQWFACPSGSPARTGKIGLLILRGLAARG
jgi:hypothetical protein